MINIFTRKKMLTTTLLIQMMGEYLEERRGMIQLKRNLDNEEEYKRLSRLGLENSLNARLLRNNIESTEKVNQDYEMSLRLLDFVKELRRTFGESTFLIEHKKFFELCKKYKLKIGFLLDYTGAVPEKNIQEIERFRENLKRFPIKGLNSRLHLVSKINTSGGSEEDAIEVESWLRKNNNFVVKLSNTDYYDRRDVRYYEGAPRLRYNSLTTIEAIPIKDDTLLIAAPKNLLKKRKLEILRRPLDPIVFQYSPYGIVIHSIWGEESEDQIIKEYQRFNDLVM